MKPETRFRQGKVLPFLKTLKNTWFEPIQQKAINGSPDYMLCVWGRFVALELKSRGGKVSALQQHKLNEINRTGGIAIIADPDNWENAKQLLSAMDGGVLHGNAQVKG